MTRVVVGTQNPHKVVEVQRILAAAEIDIALVSLAELSAAGTQPIPDVAETGVTFAENALIKARAVAAYTGLPALADDSGLCVDALNGMPGVLSARWSGRHGDDVANVRLLLDQLVDVPAPRRGAHFACAAALVTPAGIERVSEGFLPGTVITAPRGTNGFGYDPVFLPEGDSRTTAELPPHAKDAISHRGRALRGLVPHLAELL